MMGKTFLTESSPIEQETRGSTNHGRYTHIVSCLGCYRGTGSSIPRKRELDVLRWYSGEEGRRQLIGRREAIPCLRLFHFGCSLPLFLSCLDSDYAPLKDYTSALQSSSPFPACRSSRSLLVPRLVRGSAPHTLFSCVFPRLPGRHAARERRLLPLLPLHSLGCFCCRLADAVNISALH